MKVSFSKVVVIIGPININFPNGTTYCWMGFDILLINLEYSTVEAMINYYIFTEYNYQEDNFDSGFPLRSSKVS